MGQFVTQPKKDDVLRVSLKSLNVYKLGDMVYKLGDMVYKLFDSKNNITVPKALGDNHLSEHDLV